MFSFYNKCVQYLGNVFVKVTLICAVIFLPVISWGQPLADGMDKFLGCAYSYFQKPDFEKYWNQVTPENEGKWGSVEGARDQMNWGPLDEAYNFAKSNGFKFRFHVLIWGNQQPGWIAALDPAEQLEEIEEWFAAVAGRYPDIDYLEVVNEPLHDPPDDPEDGGYMEALGGAGETGWDWIIKAFELARTYFPDSTQLYMNDYSIPNSDGSTTNYLEIINLLQGRDLIDGIAIQGHAFSTTGSMATIKSNLDRLAETGLPIQVSEMDIDGPTDEIQLASYQRIFPTFWQHPAIIGITLWGWRDGMWRSAEGAYLLDPVRGAPRPAFEWLKDFLDDPLTPAIDSTIVFEDKAAALAIWYPSQGADSYTIQLSKSSRFLGIIVDTTVTDTCFQMDSLSYNTYYFWRVSATSGTGTSPFSLPVLFKTPLATSIEEHSLKPSQFALQQNYPNPFNPLTKIEYTLPDNGNIALKVYDLLGQQVAVLFQGWQSAGNHTVTFDGKDLTSGVYLYQLETGHTVISRKFILLK